MEAYPTPLTNTALEFTWDAAWRALGSPAPVSLRAELLRAWAEPHRHYHDLRHLGECLALWQRWRNRCERPGEVALALWFHDAIHNPQTPGNELQSAAWAARTLSQGGLGSDTSQRVHDLVMATRHDAVVTDPDAQVVVDIDLSILGSPPERFEAYDRDVRKEYAWVPGLRYRAARAAVLQGFLDRPNLYHGEAAIEPIEAHARLNLTAALSRLAQ